MPRLTLLVTLCCWAFASWAKAQGTPSSVPASAPVAQPAIAKSAAPAASATITESDKEKASPGEQPAWYEKASVAAMVDAYFAVNYNFPEPTNGDTAESALRAFDQATGFALSWVGLDVAYPAEPVGMTLNLRFGPSAARNAGERETELGLQIVRQAFLTWQATKRLSFDFGKFDTIYGVEAGDAHARMNYSLGTLPFFVQPNFHTGLRAGFALTDSLKLTAMVVNGFATGSLDNNLGKSFGLQLAYEAGPLFAALAYFTGPEGDDDNEHFMHLVDAAVGFKPLPGTHVMLNGNYGYEDAEGGGSSWWGAALLAQQRFSRLFRGALRGELVGDADGLLSGVPDMTWVTATLTLDAILGQALLIRLENRLDYTTEPYFLQGDNAGLEKTQLTTILGVVLYTGGI